MAAVSGVYRSINTNGDGHFASGGCGLKIIIVGGGIGGFTAAIALRQQGHDIELYEQPNFVNEDDSVVHLVPNAVGLLRRLGVHIEDEGAVLLEHIRLFKHSGELLSTANLVKDAGRWQNKWFLAHRAHLHKQLKKVAITADGKGRSVQVHTSSKVVKVDPHTGIVVLEDGTQVDSDVIIGADGVHSVTRGALTQKEFLPFKSGENAMHFSIPKASALADPITRDWVAPNGSMDIWYGPDLKILLHPCVNNTLLNGVCVHPAALSNALDGCGGIELRNKLLQIYKHFESRILRLLEKADVETVKLYPVFDMNTLPTFVNDRLALIGDAAHPFVPHLAQGDAMAIEDAISLGTMLPLGTRPDKIPERLKLYNQARYERATTIQNNYSKLENDLSKLHEFMDHGLSHDEYHASTQILRQYQWQHDKNLYWRQPTVFGPMPGPRQTFDGKSHPLSSSSSSTMTAKILFKTSATLLRNLFPNPSYSFNKSDTVALASFSIVTMQNMAWLGGGSYDLLGFYIHDVEYTTHNGEKLHGSYCPVMFENLTDPILSGREELGYPKLYSDISITPSGDSDGESNDVEVRVAWQGTEWARFSWQDLRNSTDQEPNDPRATENGRHRKNGAEVNKIGTIQQEGIFVNKCVPSSDATERNERRADAEYDVFIPDSEAGVTKLKKVRQAKQAELKIEDQGCTKLPTLHHIVSRLAEIPIFEVVEASVVDADGVSDLSGARRLQRRD